MEPIEFITAVGFAIFLALIGALVTCATKNHRSTIRMQIGLFLVAYALRFTMSFLLYAAGLGEKIVGSGDDSGWRGALLLVENWDAQGVTPFDWPVVLMGAYDGHHRGYVYVLAVYFSIARIPSQLSAAALNCAWGAMEAVITYRTARILFSEWVASRAGWWTACFPLMIIWSAQTIKEPVVILLEGTAIYGCLCIRANGMTARHLLLIAFSLAALPTIRFYAAYITGITVLLTLAMPRIRSKQMSIGAAAITAMLVVPVLFSTGRLSKDAESFQKWGSVKQVKEFRNALTVGAGSGVKTTQDMETSRGLSLATLNGVIHLFFAPFPWEFGSSVRAFLTAPEMLVWWVLLLRGILPGLKYGITRRFGDVLPLLLFLTALGLIYSLTFGNVGLIYRQRAQLFPYLVMFGAMGLEQRRQRRLGIRTHVAAAMPSSARAVQHTERRPSFDPFRLQPDLLEVARQHRALREQALQRKAKAAQADKPDGTTNRPPAGTPPEPRPPA